MTWTVYYKYHENFHWNSFLNVTNIAKSKSAQIVEPHANLITLKGKSRSTSQVMLNGLT